MFTTPAQGACAVQLLPTRRFPPAPWTQASSWEDSRMASDAPAPSLPRRLCHTQGPRLGHGADRAPASRSHAAPCVLPQHRRFSYSEGLTFTGLTSCRSSNGLCPRSTCRFRCSASVCHLSTNWHDGLSLPEPELALHGLSLRLLRSLAAASTAERADSHPGPQIGLWRGPVRVLWFLRVP